VKRKGDKKLIKFLLEKEKDFPFSKKEDLKSITFQSSRLHYLTLQIGEKVRKVKGYVKTDISF